MNNRLFELRVRIYQLLGKGRSEPTEELVELLAEWWSVKHVEFGTKMETWKAHRIEALQWAPPVLIFEITRHPGAWRRRQRWSYDFEANEADRVSEWGLRQNPSYTKQQVEKDAKRIVRAVISDSQHPCLEKKGEVVRVWLGRLPYTRPVANELPQRTARGRQVRLKAMVASLMEVQSEWERVSAKESTGSLVYRGSPD